MPLPRGRPLVDDTPSPAVIQKREAWRARKAEYRQRMRTQAAARAEPAEDTALVDQISSTWFGLRE